MQLGQPEESEIEKLEEYVNATLYQGAHPDRNRFIQARADNCEAATSCLHTVNDTSLSLTPLHMVP